MNAEQSDSQEKINAMQERIDELEKENAQLREALEDPSGFWGAQGGRIESEGS